MPEAAEKSKKPIPAWKLREQMRQKSAAPKPAQRAKQKTTGGSKFDAPLPPAFKAVRKQRLAFSKQQDRRKNNDTFVSLNSSHPDRSSHHEQSGHQEETVDIEDYSSEEDGSKDSFG